MKHILHFCYAFLTDGNGMLLVTIPIYAFLRQLYWHYKDEPLLKRRLSPERELLLLAFFVLLTMLYTQTFIVNSGINEVRFVPFGIILSQINNMHQSPSDYMNFIFNVIGNIAVFIPVGLLIAALFGKSLCNVTLKGFFISLCIEAGQLPIDRTSDIDDLILNTTGAVIGGLIFRLVSAEGFGKSKNKNKKTELKA